MYCYIFMCLYVLLVIVILIRLFKLSLSNRSCMSSYIFVMYPLWKLKQLNILYHFNGPAFN